MSDMESRRDAGVVGRGPWMLFGSAVGLMVLWAVLDSVAGAVGPGLRSGAMVYVETGARGSEVAFDDGSSEAALFLGARDSVSVVTPWEMTVDELLRLYHLENNASAREALSETVGASGPDDRVPSGTRLRFALTPATRVP